MESDPISSRFRPVSPRPWPPAAWRSAILMLALSSMLHCARPFPDDAGALPPAALEPGTVIEREIAGGGIHRFQLQVPAAHFLRLSADAHHADVELVLTGPDGEPRERLLIRAERWRPDALSALADSPGTWRLEVSSRQHFPGRFRLVFDQLRPARVTDPTRVAARRAHAEGLELLVDSAREENEKALAALRRALDLWRQIGDGGAEAVTLHWLGRVQTDLNLFDEAAGSLGRALELQRALGERAREADALHRLGVVDGDRGNYGEALEWLRQALAIYEKLEDREPAAFTLMHFGYLYNQRTEPQAALDHYRRALELLRALELRKWQANVLNNIGGTLNRLGELDEAREYFEEALPISRELGDRARVFALLNNIGWGLKAQGEPGKSLPYLEEALGIAEELGNDWYRSSALDNIGRAHLDLGQPRETLRFSRTALELSRGLGDPRGQAVRLNTLGMAQHAFGELAAAAARFEDALAISREIGNRKNELVALHGLARVHRSSGDLEAAQERVETAIEVVEDVRASVGSPALRASYLASRRTSYELLVDLLVERARQRPERRSELLGAALGAHERARARSMLESLSEALADIRSGGDPELRAREHRLRETINRIERRRQRLAVGAGGEELETARRELRKLLAEHQDVRRQIRLGDPRFAALTQPQTLRLGDIQRQVLDDESLLLEYALGDERSHLFAVTANRIEAFELPARAELEGTAQRFYELVTVDPDWPDAEPAELRRTAKALSESLLGPLSDRLAGQRLLVVAEGALQYIPFVALPVPGDSEDRPLVLDHEIVSLPSASVLAVLRRQVSGRSPAPRTLAVLADPVFMPADVRLAQAGDPDPGPATPTASPPSRDAVLHSARDAGLAEFQRLWGSRLEAEAIAELAPPAERFVALGFAASRETATSPAMGQYRILHFATHGLLHDRNPELSGLVLSLYDRHGAPRDGFLRLHDIYNLELNADLVVLSACQTALGKSIRGEGLIGLTRGFMYAGARRVVASLWRVDDRATPELMRLFYRALLQRKLAPAAALRAAQSEMLGDRADREGWREPYYWAAFVLQGEWREDS